jgi:hypothetical protein
LWTVLMKNCAPPELGPLLAIDSVPGSFDSLCAGGCSSLIRPNGEPPRPQFGLFGSLEC